jgi:hypothetical protein
MLSEDCSEQPVCDPELSILGVRPLRIMSTQSGSAFIIEVTIIGCIMFIYSVRMALLLCFSGVCTGTFGFIVVGTDFFTHSVYQELHALMAQFVCLGVAFMAVVFFSRMVRLLFLYKRHTDQELGNAKTVLRLQTEMAKADATRKAHEDMTGYLCHEVNKLQYLVIP